MKGCVELNSHCWYCGCEITPGLFKPNGVPHPQMRTKDHVVPKSRGGKRKIPCCFTCNKWKKTLTLDQFRVKFKRLYPNWDGKFWYEKQGIELINL